MDAHTHTHTHTRTTQRRGKAKGERRSDRTHSSVVFLAAADVCGHGEGGPGLGVYDECAFIGPEGTFEVAHGLCGAAWIGTGERAHARAAGRETAELGSKGMPS
jgi:hypothetical protein